MKFKERLMTLSVIALLVVSMTIPAYASQDDSEIQGFEKISNKISFHGEEFALLDTYAEPKEAYDYYINKYDEQINTLKEKYNLP